MALSDRPDFAWILTKLDRAKRQEQQEEEQEQQEQHQEYTSEAYDTTDTGAKSRSLELLALRPGLTQALQQQTDQQPRRTGEPEEEDPQHRPRPSIVCEQAHARKCQVAKCDKG
jgi:hypothetical protein